MYNFYWQHVQVYLSLYTGDAKVDIQSINQYILCAHILFFITAYLLLHHPPSYGMAKPLHGF